MSREKEQSIDYLKKQLVLMLVLIFSLGKAL
jgi:hypothetical protein